MKKREERNADLLKPNKDIILKRTQTQDNNILLSSLIQPNKL